MKARLDRHARYRELLAARLGRSLTRAENRLLVSHLRACPDCQQAERDYRDQSALLRSLNPPSPPRDMWARTSSALDREVSRPTLRYPRRRRPPVVHDDQRHAGTPSALATAVAALGVATVLSVLQLAPALAPENAPDQATDADGALPPRATPFSVAPQPLTVVSAGDRDLSVYRTQVSQVCPAAAPDCFEGTDLISGTFGRRTVALENLRPENVTLNPAGDQLAFVGHNSDDEVFAVVMLQTADELADDERPPRRPTDAPPPPSLPAATATAKPPTAPPEVTPSVKPVATVSPDPEATPVEPSVTPDVSPSPSEKVKLAQSEAPATPKATAAKPPPSAVAGLTVLSILEDVHSAGAPPAWSRNGDTLAFSAMPSDGSQGPDVYVWRPGDRRARAITTDHASFFASWSGQRIVASRIADPASGADGVVTVVIDPSTLAERTVDGPAMWLPVVDPQRENAVVWDGRLDLRGVMPQLRNGELYLVDWSRLDPFRDGSDADDVELVAIDPSRRPASAPVLDWHVRWSTDGRVLGIWEADSPGASWGKLVLAALDAKTGTLAIDDPLIGPQLSKRGFALGADRVAWVGPSDSGTDGALRIRTWGSGGSGDLRIDSTDVKEIVPSL